MAKKEEAVVEQQKVEAVEEQTAEEQQKAPEAVAENATPEEQTVETVTKEEVENAEVPEDAEEITNEEAFAAAVAEVNRLREENTALKQTLDAKNTEIQEIVTKTNEEAGNSIKKILELEEKVKELEGQVQKLAADGDNSFFIDLLEEITAKMNEYAGLRRERLRKEFVTDIVELIEKQKDLLKNA